MKTSKIHTLTNKKVGSNKKDIFHLEDVFLYDTQKWGRSNIRSKLAASEYFFNYLSCIATNQFMIYIISLLYFAFKKRKAFPLNHFKTRPFFFIFLLRLLQTFLQYSFTLHCFLLFHQDPYRLLKYQVYLLWNLLIQ